jgi:hypothetical protein
VRRGRGLDLFVDGRRYAVPRSIAEAGPVLTRRRRVDRDRVGLLLREPPFVALAS